MKKTSKLLLTCALAGILSAGTAITAFAAWEQDSTGWKYGNGDGSYKTSVWFMDTDAAQTPWYHFQATGYMNTGWYKDTDGKWYFLASSGAMQRGGVFEIDGATYYLNMDGSLYVGNMDIEGVTYNFTETGLADGKKISTNEKWNGNGTRVGSTTMAKAGASSGGSSGGGSSYSTPVERIDSQISKNANKTYAGIDSMSYAVGTKTLTINPTAGATGKQIADAAGDAVVTALKQASVADGSTIKNIKIDGATIVTPPTFNSVDEAVTYIQNSPLALAPASGTYTVYADVNGTTETWTIDVQ